MRRAARLSLVVGLTACAGGGEDDPTPTDPDPPGAWTPVAEGLPSALLSVSGTSDGDVWAVGADTDGTGPLVLHWDGAAWARHDVGSPGTLWWVWEAGPDDLWFAGTGGRVVRYTPSTGVSTVELLDPAATLFGIWGSGPDDVWAVGGNLALSSNGAQVWHSDGAEWAIVDSLPAEAAATTSMYKVWGTAADDVWVCGLGGTVVHWDGAEWRPSPTGTTQPLFTIHGTSTTDVYAVGGAGNGVLLHWDGDAWTDETPPFVETLQGVNATADRVAVVGWGGKVLVRDGGTWIEDPRGRAAFGDLHAVWQDGGDGLWTVGGDLGGATLGQGVMVYGGGSPPAAYRP